MTPIGTALLTSKVAQVGELVALFLVAGATIWGLGPLAGEDPLARQLVVWIANVLMIGTVWLGLRLRGQGWQHFGLSFQLPGRGAMVRVVLQSVLVCVVAVIAFAVGAVVMANIAGRPEAADLSGYDFLRNNLALFLLCLAGVYIVSSFGEEVVYRAFLMNRIAEMGGGSRWAWRVAVIVSSVVFGAVHYEWGRTGIVQTAFMGLALSISYLAVGRNLWATILAHVYLDTALLLPIYLAGD